jgi:uncharacterized protein (TIGR00369 family)
MSESHGSGATPDKGHPVVGQLNAYNGSIPFNSWLGAEIISAQTDRLRLRVPWRPEFAAAPGITHGGVLAGVIETAAFMVLKASRGDAGPTVDMRVDYHRSSAGDTLYAHARLLRAGGTISTAEVFVEDSRERLIASGRCVFLSHSQPASGASLEPAHVHTLYGLRSP